MRSKMIAALCAVCLLLGGCAPVVGSEKDEIRLYDWENEFENGKTVSLSFGGSSAALSVDSGDFSMTVAGLCSLTDDSFVIYDADSGMNYEFGYILHGDCIELSYRGDEIRLLKKVED